MKGATAPSHRPSQTLFRPSRHSLLATTASIATTSIAIAPIAITRVYFGFHCHEVRVELAEEVPVEQNIASLVGIDYRRFLVFHLLTDHLEIRPDADRPLAQGNREHSS